MNRIAFMLALTAGIACAAFGYEPPRHNDTFTTNGITYAQRGGLGASDYVVTNIDASAIGKVQSVNGKTGEVQLNASDVGAVPLVEDQHGEKTAVTIGSRRGIAGMFSLAHGSNVSATEYYSHAEGENTSAYGYCSHSEGESTTASGAYSHAEGIDSKTEKDHAYAFAWNGDSSRSSPYTSHGPGTYNINPVGGLNGFYIGEQTLLSIMSDKADKATPSAAGNLAALTADGNLADSEVPATRVPTAAKQLEWDGKRDRTDLSLDTWIAGEGAPESIKGQPQWVEDLECWAWDWYTPGGVYESFRTTNASSSDDPGPIEFYDELDITSGRHFTATRDRIAKESQLTSKADRSMISATNTTFSDAVLAVGLNIDTNSVAVLNEIAATFGGFPIEGTATTAGGLLAALAAAIAWLKKNKVGSFESVGGASATVKDGVAKLDDFFTESNSLLNGRLAYSRNATGLKDRAFNTLSFDGTEFNLSTALEGVTPTASGQPRDLLIVATATAATTIGYTAGTIKGDKPTIDGSGTWLITLTEYASGVWYCRQIKMEDAA